MWTVAHCISETVMKFSSWGHETLLGARDLSILSPVYWHEQILFDKLSFIWSNAFDEKLAC
jgi:hypothetical protein